MKNLTFIRHSFFFTVLELEEQQEKRVEKTRWKNEEVLLLNTLFCRSLVNISSMIIVFRLAVVIVAVAVVVE